MSKEKFKTIFAESVRNLLSEPKENQVVQQNSSWTTNLDQIEKLAKMKENGILEEEFTEQKKKTIRKIIKS
jgi:hypothetical protein